MTHPHFSLSAVRTIQFPRFDEDTGALSVYEGNSDIPFDIARTYSIRALKDAVRGNHAHYRCAQVVICVHGGVEVVCQDGDGTQTFKLETPDQGLFIPPTIWAAQTYLEPDTVVIVVCDRPYEADDYIHDFDAYLSFRAAHEQ